MIWILHPTVIFNLFHGMIVLFPDDVDTDLLRLLAAKAMNPKPANKKGDSLKRPKRSTSVSDFS